MNLIRANLIFYDSILKKYNSGNYFYLNVEHIITISENYVDEKDIVDKNWRILTVEINGNYGRPIRIISKDLEKYL